MVANFHTSVTIPCVGFLKGLNSILPDDVRIIDVSDVDNEFHARFNAVGKAYVYNFIVAPVILPTERLYFSHIPFANLDLTEIATCLEILLGEHDFSSFEATGSRDLTRQGGIGAVRTIHSAKLVEKDNSKTHFQIEIRGNGFLRHMVRNIVGTLFEAGVGKINAADFAGILRGKDRSLAGATAPAKGLFLKEVFY
jgi:tRNA pseudouridine38-40 synthase